MSEIDAHRDVFKGADPQRLRARSTDPLMIGPLSKYAPTLDAAGDFLRLSLTCPVHGDAHARLSIPVHRKPFVNRPGAQRWQITGTLDRLTMIPWIAPHCGACFRIVAGDVYTVRKTPR